jgi:hypothetical protein
MLVIYITLKLASPTLHPLNVFFFVFFTKVGILHRTPNLFIDVTQAAGGRGT